MGGAPPQWRHPHQVARVTRRPWWRRRQRPPRRLRSRCHRRRRRRRRASCRPAVGIAANKAATRTVVTPTWWPRGSRRRWGAWPPLSIRGRQRRRRHRHCCRPRRRPRRRRRQRRRAPRMSPTLPPPPPPLSRALVPLLSMWHTWMRSTVAAVVVVTVVAVAVVVTTVAVMRTPIRTRAVTNGAVKAVAMTTMAVVAATLVRTAAALAAVATTLSVGMAMTLGQRAALPVRTPLPRRSAPHAVTLRTLAAVPTAESAAPVRTAVLVASWAARLSEVATRTANSGVPTKTRAATRTMWKPRSACSASLMT